MPKTFETQISGLGLSFRPEFAEFWPDIKPSLDCAEYIPDELATNRPLFELTKWAVTGLPAMAHSTGLSVGSPQALEEELLDGMRNAISGIGAVCQSDHLCFRRAGEIEIHNFCLPFADDISLNVILDNLKSYEELMGRPIFLENITINGGFGKNPLLTDELYLFNALADNGHKVLFDVNNAFMNCRNFDLDIAAYLNQFPMNAIAGLHIAGHEVEDGWYVDTHMHPISDEVITLTKLVLSRSPASFVVLERDNSSASYDQLMVEIDSIRTAWDAER